MSATDQPQRLISLDVFRGLTIAGMILVNNPGDWGNIYGPLGHARWHGWTPTDLVFPFFLFIVGVSMAYSFRRRLDRGDERWALFGQVVRRSIMIFLCGLVLSSFGLLLDDRDNWPLITAYVLGLVGTELLFTQATEGGKPQTRRVAGCAVLIGAAAIFWMGFERFQVTGQRIPGVLQRIAVCYLMASIIVMFTGMRGQVLSALILLGGYLWIVNAFSAPEGYSAEVTGAEGLLHDWIDVQLLAGHLYRARPDPEGILSTLPAIATVLTGVLAGQWLRRTGNQGDKLIGLFVAANFLLVGGLALDAVDPINKKLWSSSYVLLTAGLALHVLAMCFWLVDVRCRKFWATPFLVLGSNAIVAYTASSLGAVALGRLKMTSATGELVAIKTWIYRCFFAAHFEPCNASLLYALSYVALWMLLLAPLYWRRIFIKI